MSYLPLALSHAENGYYVFPVTPVKIPPKGFLDWENAASRDPELIRKWWEEEYPGCIPAIAPGRSGLAVIDVDLHDDSPDGFASLRSNGVHIEDDWVQGVSLSGNGRHLWFRRDIGSRNRVLPGVDRKAQGGYVVAPYELPPAESINTQMPEILTFNPLFSNIERRQMSSGDLDEWLETVGGGPISEPMYAVLATFQPTGNSQMSSSIARVVSIAAHGSSGAAKALEKMLDIWESGTHYSGDPSAEFMVNVKSAIQKFGAPVSTDSAEAFYALLSEETPKINLQSLSASLAVYCDKVFPEWRTDEHWVRVYRACEDSLKDIASLEDVSTWRTKTKQIIDKLKEATHA